MKITNNQGLPQPLVDAVSFGSRVPKEKHISVTQLIDSPQIRFLRAKHWQDIEEDASDRIWALLGSSVHYVLYRHADKNCFSEEGLRSNILGWRLTGIPDLMEADGTLSDYKITSVWSFLLSDKKTWEAQLNCYAFLFRNIGFHAEKLQIVAILRDWSKGRSHEEGYPDHNVLVKQIPLWSHQETLNYIGDRLEAHENLDAICTPEEQWARPDAWAAKKKKNKTAKGGKVCDTIQAAKHYIDGKPDAPLWEIEYRPGKLVRCEDYCNVAQWCPQIAGGELHEPLNLPRTERECDDRWGHLPY